MTPQGFQVLQLYPDIGTKQALTNLYLKEQLHTLATREKPFIYGNFVASLDGRIALTDKNSGEPYVPESLTTVSDWLLFQQLQAQADCFITHGGYLRSLAAGTLDNILQIGLGADNKHLLSWRQANGLERQPGIVVVSASLDFPIPSFIHVHDQDFYIVTSQSADPIKVKKLQKQGFEVAFAGSGKYVEGRPLVDKLMQWGFRSIYLEAGPIILRTMLRDGVLSRLYLTMSHQLLGGESYHSLLAGPELGQAGRLKLRSMYFDALSDKQTGQFFACFEPADHKPPG